jgi:hypothetical protein
MEMLTQFLKQTMALETLVSNTHHVVKLGKQGGQQPILVKSTSFVRKTLAIHTYIHTYIHIYIYMYNIMFKVSKIRLDTIFVWKSGL